MKLKHAFELTLGSLIASSVIFTLCLTYSVLEHWPAKETYLRFTNLPADYEVRIFCQDRLHHNLAKVWLQCYDLSKMQCTVPVAVLTEKLTQAKLQTDAECKRLLQQSSQEAGESSTPFISFVAWLAYFGFCFYLWVKNIFRNVEQRDRRNSWNWLESTQANRVFFFTCISAGLIVLTLRASSIHANIVNLSSPNTPPSMFTRMPEGMDETEWLKIQLHGAEWQKALSFSKSFDSAEQIIAHIDQHFADIKELANSTPNEFLMAPAQVHEPDWLDHLFESLFQILCLHVLLSCLAKFYVGALEKYVQRHPQWKADFMDWTSRIALIAITITTTCGPTLPRFFQTELTLSKEGDTKAPPQQRDSISPEVTIEKDVERPGLTKRTPAEIAELQKNAHEKRIQGWDWQIREQEKANLRKQIGYQVEHYQRYDLEAKALEAKATQTLKQAAEIRQSAAQLESRGSIASGYAEAHVARERSNKLKHEAEDELYRARQKRDSASRTTNPTDKRYLIQKAEEHEVKAAKLNRDAASGGTYSSQTTSSRNSAYAAVEELKQKARRVEAEAKQLKQLEAQNRQLAQEAESKRALLQKQLAALEGKR